jgi:hypothetical protein
MDIIPKLSSRGLTMVTKFLHFLLIVDRYSRRPLFTGITDKSTAAVIDVVQEFQAPTSHHINLQLNQMKQSLLKQMQGVNLHLRNLKMHAYPQT